jgi:hypothetical protein
MLLYRYKFWNIDCCGFVNVDHLSKTTRTSGLHLSLSWVRSRYLETMNKRYAAAVPGHTSLGCVSYVEELKTAEGIFEKPFHDEFEGCVWHYSISCVWYYNISCVWHYNISCLTLRYIVFLALQYIVFGTIIYRVFGTRIYRVWHYNGSWLSSHSARCGRLSQPALETLCDWGKLRRRPAGAFFKPAKDTIRRAS